MTAVEFEEWVQWVLVQRGPPPKGKRGSDWWKVPYKIRLKIIKVQRLSRSMSTG